MYITILNSDVLCFNRNFVLCCQLADQVMDGSKVDELVVMPITEQNVLKLSASIKNSLCKEYSTNASDLHVVLLGQSETDLSWLE